jgi:two-component system, chemotaxis family, chemotaxis protein CheY
MRTVLVVEDDDDLRDVVSETLERNGFRALGASDGVAALELLAREPLPCLILLDLMMPRMSGWEFRRRQLADARLQRVPVVVMTATTTLDEAAIHADDLLRKPLSLPALLAAVRRFARSESTPGDINASGA